MTEDGGPRRAPLREAGGAAAAGTSTLPASKGHVGGLGEEQDAGGPPKKRKNKSKRCLVYGPDGTEVCALGCKEQGQAVAMRSWGNRE